jgi:hypothetical protein
MHATDNSGPYSTTTTYLRDNTWQVILIVYAVHHELACQTLRFLFDRQYFNTVRSPRTDLISRRA